MKKRRRGAASRSSRAGIGQGACPWAFVASPARLILCANSPLLSAAQPLGPARPISYEGRKAWEICLRTPPPVPHLRLVVDDSAGILLRAQSLDGDYREQLTQLDFRDVPDDHFRWSSDLADAQRRRLAALERLDAYHAGGRPLPVPARWPGDLGRPQPFDGDPGTGFVVVDLNVEPRPNDTLRGALLVRVPLTERPYTGGRMLDPELFVHRWLDARWQWALILERRPLTRQELRSVEESLANS